MQIQVDALSVQFLQNAAPDPAALRPSRSTDHAATISTSLPGNRLEQLVEPGAPITALGTADALVFEHGHHLPAVALGDSLQLAFLVLDGLLVGLDPDVQGDPAVSLGIHVGSFSFAADCTINS